jgi:hypothetical protein
MICALGLADREKMIAKIAHLKSKQAQGGKAESLSLTRILDALRNVAKLVCDVHQSGRARRVRSAKFPWVPGYAKGIPGYPKNNSRLKTAVFISKALILLMQ